MVVPFYVKRSHTKLRSDFNDSRKFWNAEIKRVTGIAFLLPRISPDNGRTRVSSRGKSDRLTEIYFCPKTSKVSRSTARARAHCKNSMPELNNRSFDQQIITYVSRAVFVMIYLIRGIPRARARIIRAHKYDWLYFHRGFPVVGSS